ncbi:hypothetical protein [Clostridium saudiense]|nr:hypothetical protein [Clostridium saudiense]
MDSKAREIKNAYMREWRARNKDKVQASQERYWQKKAKELAMLKEQEESD